MQAKTILFGIVLLFIGVGAGYVFFGQKTTISPPTPLETTTVKPIQTPTPTPVVDEKEAIISAVRTGLITEHGQNAGAMKITVSRIEGDFALGGAKEEEAVGGGMWLAAKTSEGWVLVWDGNGTISCEVTDPYNFPVSLLPECWNETTGKLIKR